MIIEYPNALTAIILILIISIIIQGLTIISILLHTRKQRHIIRQMREHEKFQDRIIVGINDFISPSPVSTPASQAYPESDSDPKYAIPAEYRTKEEIDEQYGPSPRQDSAL